jgi:DNA-binding XRE family transcriptional regulator
MTLKENGQPAAAVVPIELWNGMIEEMEDLKDAQEAQIISRKILSGEEETFPHEFVIALLDKKDHPLKIWRKYRGFTLETLAKTVGVTKSALSMIENGKSVPSGKLLKRLAENLNCDMEDIFDDGAEDEYSNPDESATISRVAEKG